MAWLIAKRAAINAIDKELLAPLHIAVHASYMASVKCLVEAGADLNVRSENGRTSLHIASISGFATLVSFLLDNGADVEATDDQNKVPAFLAAAHHHPCALALLLQAHVQRETHTAAATGDLGTIIRLVDQGENVDA
jgi:ankyrin repeat protein